MSQQSTVQSHYESTKNSLKRDKLDQKNNVSIADHFRTNNTEISVTLKAEFVKVEV